MIRDFLKLKRLWLLIFFPAFMILNAVARYNVTFAEWYSTSVYTPLSYFINNISSLFPFSLAEIILIIFSITVILYLVLYTIRIIKNKSQYLFNTFKFILNIIIIVGIFAFFFTIFCGINYHRMPFSEKIGLNSQPYSKNVLIDLCKDLSLKANELRININIDKLSYNNFDSISDEACISYEKLSHIYPGIISDYGKAKAVFFSYIMSLGKITGFFFPFTCEANVNIHVPAYTIPSTVCHELAHLHGYMREDEANFISFLACIGSDKKEFQYSGAITAYIYTSNALYNADREAYYEIYESLNEDVKSDLKTSINYWSQFDGFVANLSNKINDTYLKANDQTDGVQSYGMMVDLLISYYMAKKTQ